jgi:hypothetical protein
MFVSVLIHRLKQAVFMVCMYSIGLIMIKCAGKVGPASDGFLVLL